MNVQHSSQSDSWYTPLWLVEKIHEVLGTIDLDPASCPLANERIRARRIFTEQTDGLTSDWGLGPLTVYINPPGGKVGNKSQTVLFWRRLMIYGRLRHAMFMCFSVEALQSSQNKGVRAIGEFPFCVPSKRIAFDNADGQTRHQPTHSNAIVYVPGMVDHTDRFRQVFADVGTVIGA